MRRHRPAMPAGCQAAGDVKSAAQNFKTSHKLPHPLCAAPPPSFTTPPPSLPPSCSCFASWPFLSLHCAKIKIYEGCKKQQRQRGGSERKARGRGGYGACCQGHSNVGERGGGGRNECAKKFNAQMITNESSTAHKVVLHSLHSSPLHPPSPHPLLHWHTPSALCPFSFGTAPLPAGNCVIANQINGRDVIAAICIVLPKVFAQRRRKRSRRKGRGRGRGRGKEGKSEWMQRMDECIQFETTHTHTAIKQKTLWSRSYYVWIHFNWAEERS